MYLKLKYRISIAPDINGEYPEDIAKRLIFAGLAEEDISKKQNKQTIKKVENNRK